MTTHPELEPLKAFDEPKLEALVEMMVLSASADGDFQPEERERLSTAILTLTSRRIEPGHLDGLLDNLGKRIASEGREARLANVAKVLDNEGVRKVAVDLALQVMVADGVLRTSERELVREMIEVLGLPPDEAADRIKALMP